MARRSYRFTPYQPPQPPAGSYDPALDSQKQAAGRGLLDMRQDLETQGTRALSDYGTGTEALGRNYQDSLNQTGAARTRENEDYSRNVGLLTRRYGQLGDQQTEQANAAGVINGGALLQSAAKRSENQGIEQTGLDTAHRRTLEDLTAREASVTADEGAQAGQLALTLNRGGEDRTTQLQRALRENSAFGLDLNAQRAYQAAGSGWAPPGRGQPGGMPKNEFVNAATGAHTRVIIRGNERLTVDPSGNILSRRPR